MSEYTPAIVEGVMREVLREIGRVVWNCLQQPWGEEWNAPFVPLQCGDVSVEIETTEAAGFRHMDVCAFGSKVGTWLDSKRTYYHAHLPDHWGNYDFIRWADLVLKHLGDLDRERHMNRAAPPRVVVRASPMEIAE